MASRKHGHSDSLVEADWLQERLGDPDIRVVESNDDVLLYDTGHIPGAVHINWGTDLQDAVIRDCIGPKAFAELCEFNGISPETTCIFYGDRANWWACYALWAFRLFGHDKVKILNGGREKWIREHRPTTRQKPQYPHSRYPVRPRRGDAAIRAFFGDALEFSKSGQALLDVRSPDEFRGALTHVAERNQEGVLRGGHIPGAQSVPWELAANDDGTFKSRAELQKIYVEGLGLKPRGPAIVYCRTGERSSHTWFVLNDLLGFNRVRNYDGAWIEWGNRVRAPIERDG